MALEAHFKQINERLERIEARVRTLSKLEGVPYEDPNAAVPEEVFQLAREGRRSRPRRHPARPPARGGDGAIEVVSGI